MLVCFEKNKSFSLLAALNEAYDSIPFGRRTRIVEPSFVLEPHRHKRTRITGGEAQAAFSWSQTSLCQKPSFPSPRDPSWNASSHLPSIWTLSLKIDVTFQKSFSQEPHSFLKYQSLRLSFSLSRQKLSYKFLILFSFCSL